MELTKADWEEVIQECKKQYDLMVDALKGIIKSATLQGVTFERALEEHKKAKI